MYLKILDPSIDKMFLYSCLMIIMYTYSVVRWLTRVQKFAVENIYGEPVAVNFQDLSNYLQNLLANITFLNKTNSFDHRHNLLTRVFDENENGDK